MKKFKLNLLTLLAVFITASVFMACSSDDNLYPNSNDSKLQHEMIPVVNENFNTNTNRQIIKDLFTKGTRLNKELEKSRLNTSMSKNEEIDIVQLMNDYQECSVCPLEYKDIVIPFFEEIINLDDNEITGKIEEYEAQIELINLNEMHKDNLRFLFFTFKATTNYSLNEISVNKEGSPGKTIGRGLAGGFLAGCATGAYIGATAGTVTVPLLGTAVGAVGGCIFGGAWGAATGTAVGSVWAAFDSIF